MRLKCSTAIAALWPERERRRREHQQRRGAACGRHLGEARRFEAAVGPDAVDQRQLVADLVAGDFEHAASARRTVQDATSVECALMVTADSPSAEVTSRRCLRKLASSIDEVVMERQDHGRDDAMRDIALVTAAFRGLLQVQSGRPIWATNCRQVSFGPIFSYYARKFGW